VLVLSSPRRLKPNYLGFIPESAWSEIRRNGRIGKNKYFLKPVLLGHRRTIRLHFAPARPTCRGHQPLGLTNTYFSPPPPAQSAIGYTMNQTSVIPALVCDRSTAFAAGALSSNVSDLIAWDNALINGKVVSPASFTAMTTPVSSSIPGGGSYGFGLFLRTFDNHPTIWHSGGINGFTAENNGFLDSGFAVVVLTNSDAADPDTISTEIMGAVCTSAQFSSNC
jgi:beta-lactamase family protein